MQLSKNFFLHEFHRSETAARKGRTIEPTAETTMQLQRLVALIMQPIRDHLGRPITILSGYRPPWLNKMVGGSSTSEHMVGRACDFLVQGMRPIEVVRKLEPFLKELPYNQCIHEFGVWTHISVQVEGQKPRQQKVTATKSKGPTTVYLPGFVDVEK